MICEQNGCGCALTVVSGTITGSGTPADPWVLNVADSPSITQLEIDVANIFAALDALPGTYVNVTGDTMSDALAIQKSAGGQLLSLSVDGTAYVFAGFYQAGTRHGWVGAHQTDGDMWIAADLTDLVLSATLGEVAFRAANVERMRLTSGALLIGKTTSNIANAGAELLTGGRQSLTDASGPAAQFSLNKTSAGVASGTIFADFRLTNTVIGSITRNAATSAVLYNTASDADLKTIIDDLDPELAEYVLALITPVMFTWNDDETDTPIVGYIAQKVATAWPQSVELGLVTPGVGDVSDRTWDKDGNETTPEGVWRPWMMSHTVLIPLLHASLVRTTTKLSYLRAEFDEFKASVEDRLAALEDS